MMRAVDTKSAALIFVELFRNYAEQQTGQKNYLFGVLKQQ